MIISGFDKLSLVNYPGVVACTIFTLGCPWRCKFCQNSTLATGTDENRVPEQEVLDYLKKRKGLVDGICISGGEPTIQPGLTEFAQKCKDLGVKVKLDTNGVNPSRVEEMLKAEVLDYIAMDIKLPLNNYEDVICTWADPDVLHKTINLIKKYGRGVKQNGHTYKIDYEFRTTIMKEFHDKKTISRIMEELDDDSHYYLQNFEDSEYVFDHTLHGFSDYELRDLDKWMKEKHKLASVRGLKYPDATRARDPRFYQTD